MQTLRITQGLLFLTLFSFVSRVAADPAPATTTVPENPVAVVQKLYTACVKHSTGFNVPSVKLVKPWVAPDLYARILKKVNQPTPKGEAPDITGDIFLDAQQFPKSFTVGAATCDERGVRVEVVLEWPNEERHYSVSVAQIDGDWKVTDVEFDKDGTLSMLLD